MDQGEQVYDLVRMRTEQMHPQENTSGFSGAGIADQRG